LDVWLSYDGGLTLLAPGVAILAALITRQVVPSLMAGVAVGGFVAAEGDIFGASTLIVQSVMEAIGFGVTADKSASLFHFLGNNWSLSWDHLIIVGFSIMVAACVGVMSASGATRALVMLIERYAKGPRGAMLTSWLAGMVVFFDDYANCLVVGNAMGPLCDRCRVSRAKLAYIVDSTAAPIASLALVSTWVGYEVGLVEQALVQAGSEARAFDVFIQALPYRFYSIFTIVFVGAIAFSGRDFGPMAVEEQAARRRSLTNSISRGKLPQDGHWWIAALTVLTLVVMTFYLMLSSGWAALGAGASDAPLFEVLGQADPYMSMLLASLTAFGLAAFLSLATRTLSLTGVFRSGWRGATTVFDAIAILLMAWSLGTVIGYTNAANFIAAVLSESLPVFLLPSVTFLLAAGTAFATGTSFGTMGILIPLVVPLSLGLSGDIVGPVVYASTAAVLAGACLGDHASPISDTTVLSSVGAKVDVVLHVNTQMPYAICTGLVSIFAGYLPVSLGVSPWVALPLGAVACVAIVVLVGRPVEQQLVATQK
jgi:Na+/H+ antiporter NhaC